MFIQAKEFQLNLDNSTSRDEQKKKLKMFRQDLH